MSDLLEFRLLKYIAMIAETGNFTRAAEKLYISQPSLSEQIKNLEEGLGIEIFERGRLRVEPTPAGLVLVNFAKESVRARNEIVKAARAIHQGEVPPLRLGFSCFVPTSVLEGFQRLYESVFPACPVHLAGGDPAQIVDRLVAWSRHLMVHSYPQRGRRHYGAGSTSGRHNDRGGSSSDTT
jgi:DNA-binding transcriptional LysR family regulator